MHNNVWQSIKREVSVAACPTGMNQ